MEKMELTMKYNEANIVDAYWEKLRPLSTKAKLKLVALLTTAVLEDENITEEPTSQRRVAKVIRRYANSPSDAELQARFEGKDMPEQPEKLHN
ncbi:MAG: hypothetical protein II949_02150 [Prevotella sp.]|nr:hypothetical protein [Prevotella sp.]